MTKSQGGGIFILMKLSWPTANGNGTSQGRGAWYYSQRQVLVASLKPGLNLILLPDRFKLATSNWKNASENPKKTAWDLRGHPSSDISLTFTTTIQHPHPPLDILNSLLIFRSCLPAVVSPRFYVVRWLIYYYSTIYTSTLVNYLVHNIQAFGALWWLFDSLPCVSHLDQASNQLALDGKPSAYATTTRPCWCLEWSLIGTKDHAYKLEKMRATCEKIRRNLEPRVKRKCSSGYDSDWNILERLIRSCYLQCPAMHHSKGIILSGQYGACLH